MPYLGNLSGWDCACWVFCAQGVFQSGKRLAGCFGKPLFYFPFFRCKAFESMLVITALWGSANAAQERMSARKQVRARTDKESLWRITVNMNCIYREKSSIIPTVQ